MYDFDLLKMDFDEAVILLTQHAHGCEPIGIDAVKELYKNEILREEIKNDVESYVGDYNNFLADDYYFDDKLYKSLDDLMPGARPEEVAKAVFYGSYNYAFPYVRFDGSGNVKSLQEYEVKREMLDNDNFLNYLIENNADFDEEEYSELIEATNKELRKESLMW